MSRAKLYQILQTDAASAVSGALGAIGLKRENIYLTGIDSPHGEVFLIIKFGEMTRGMGPVNRSNVTVWAYDKDRDYQRIDQMLKRIRVLFEAVEATQTDTGWITTIRWTGDSEDLFDDVYRASARNSAYQMTDSGR